MKHRFQYTILNFMNKEDNFYLIDMRRTLFIEYTKKKYIQM